MGANDITLVHQNETVRGGAKILPQVRPRGCISVKNEKLSFLRETPKSLTVNLAKVLLRHLASRVREIQMIRHNAPAFVRVRRFTKLLEKSRNV